MDREKVIKELESLRDICNAKSNMAIGKGKIAWAGYANSAEDALALLKEQEAKAGKWERQYSRPGVYANLFWWCSVCKEPTKYYEAGIYFNYCPWCGAKLEPGRET